MFQRTKFNDDFLMMVCEKNKLSENKLPRLRQQCWDEIAIQYNDGQGTNFTRAQVIARYKNYQSELKNQMMRTQEETVNVKTEISDDNFEVGSTDNNQIASTKSMDIKHEDISKEKADVLCDLKQQNQNTICQMVKKLKREQNSTMML